MCRLLPYFGQLSFHGGDCDMKNIVLIGMMGCGKSTCGQLLAQALGRTFVDSDSLIEAEQHRTISEIFAADGEPFFRALEERTARSLSERENLVIACGGGLPMADSAMQPLADTGAVVFLLRDPAEIFRRVTMDNRPLAQDGEAAFLARYAAREPVYRRWADLIVPSQPTAQDTVTLLLEKLRTLEGIR